MRAHETEILGVLYECDPCKNTECKKTSCKLLLKGECSMTTKKEFAKDGQENNPRIFRKPIQVVRIVAPTGKAMGVIYRWFDEIDDGHAYGVPLKKFQKLYSKKELEDFKEKQFKFIIYSPSEYDIISDTLIGFSLDTSCPKECFDLDFLSGNPAKTYKLTNHEQ